MFSNNYHITTTKVWLYLKEFTNIGLLVNINLIYKEILIKYSHSSSYYLNRFTHVNLLNYLIKT